MTKELPYKAPDFTLTDSDGDTHSLADYQGKWLILYFYPKDDTPGCTIEACSFRDGYETLASEDAEVVGISKDDAKNHAKFITKHDLPFTLLSDVEGKAIEAYGAWGKKMFGQEGILRKTFIINPKGLIVKVYGRVKPIGHAEQVREDLRQLKQA